MNRETGEAAKNAAVAGEPAKSGTGPGNGHSMECEPEPKTADKFNPIHLRLKDAVGDPAPGPTIARLQARAANRRREQFVLVPLEWVERLKATRCISASPLALFLLFEHWRSGGKPVSVSNVKVGLTPNRNGGACEPWNDWVWSKSKTAQNGRPWLQS